MLSFFKFTMFSGSINSTQIPPAHCHFPDKKTSVAFNCLQEKIFNSVMHNQSFHKLNSTQSGLKHFLLPHYEFSLLASSLLTHCCWILFSAFYSLLPMYARYISEIKPNLKYKPTTFSLFFFYVALWLFLPVPCIPASSEIKQVISGIVVVLKLFDTHPFKS